MTVGPLDFVAIRINQIAHQHGFYVNAAGEPIQRNFGEVLMLMVSELSESLEEDRDGKPLVYFVHDHDREGEGVDWVEVGTFTPCEHCVPKPEGAAIELVDCAIRVLDTLWEMSLIDGFSLDDLFKWKMAFNDSRPYKHGRAY